MVCNNLRNLSFNEPNLIALCLHVTLAPEVNKIHVLTAASCHGLKVVTPAGGQQQPTSTEGLKALCIKAQKKRKKKY